MRNSGQRRIPVSSRAFWLVLLLQLAVVLGITMGKDWWLTGELIVGILLSGIPGLSTPGS